MRPRNSNPSNLGGGDHSVPDWGPISSPQVIMSISALSRRPASFSHATGLADVRGRARGCIGSAVGAFFHFELPGEPEEIASTVQLGVEHGDVDGHERAVLAAVDRPI